MAMIQEVDRVEGDLCDATLLNDVSHGAARLALPYGHRASTCASGCLHYIYAA